MFFDLFFFSRAARGLGPPPAAAAASPEPKAAAAAAGVSAATAAAAPRRPPSALGQPRDHLSRHRREGVLHALPALGRSLEERDAELFGERGPLLEGDGAVLFRDVCFVADERLNSFF